MSGVFESYPDMGSDPDVVDVLLFSGPSWRPGARVCTSPWCIRVPGYSLDTWTWTRASGAPDPGCTWDLPDVPGHTGVYSNSVRDLLHFIALQRSHRYKRRPPGRGARRCKTDALTSNTIM